MVDDLAPGQKPKFLTQTAPSEEYPGEPTFDHELAALDPAAPSPAIITRYREIARMHAYGYTNVEIARALGYSEGRIGTVIKDNQFIKNEISREREKFNDADAVEIMRNAAVDGARRIYGIIKDPNAKDTTVLAASQFAIEKSHGKAVQQHNVESGTFMQYMELLKETVKRGETIDVTDTGERAAQIEGDTAVPVDQWNDWLDKNE